MRLGEALVRDGVITAAELETALQLQTQGNTDKLGTLLVQLGYLDKTKLYEYLTRRFAGAHIFAPGEEPKVSSDAVALVPKKIAEHYRLVPMTLDKDTIHIALLDPTRLPALSAVKNAAKRRVVPHVVSEDVIDVLLLRHYGIEARKRAVVRMGPITLDDEPTPAVEIVHSRPTEEKAKPLTSPSQSSVTASPSPRSAVPSPTAERGDLFGTLDLTGEADEDLPLAEAAGLLEEIDDFDVDIEEPIDLDIRSAIAPIGVEQAKNAIDRARDDQQVAVALLGATLTIFHRAALFRVKPDRTLAAWDAAGDGVSRRIFERVKIPLQARSVFGVALSSQTPFLGNIARTPENNALFAAMNWQVPRSAFCLGLWQATPYGLLYADNGGDSAASVNVNGIIELATRASIRIRILARA